MLKINRVTIGSAFRIGAVTSVIVYLAWMLLFLALVALAEQAVNDIFNESSYNEPDFNLTGGALIQILCCLPFVAIGGGIMGALYALIYNIAASWVGGLGGGHACGHDSEIQTRPVATGRVSRSRGLSGPGSRLSTRTATTGIGSLNYPGA